MNSERLEFSHPSQKLPPPAPEMLGVCDTCNTGQQLKNMGPTKFYPTGSVGCPCPSAGCKGTAFFPLHPDSQAELLKALKSPERWK